MLAKGLNTRKVQGRCPENERRGLELKTLLVYIALFVCVWGEGEVIKLILALLSGVAHLHTLLSKCSFVKFYFQHTEKLELNKYSYIKYLSLLNLSILLYLLQVSLFLTPRHQKYS